MIVICDASLRNECKSTKKWTTECKWEWSVEHDHVSELNLNEVYSCSKSKTGRVMIIEYPINR